MGIVTCITLVNIKTSDDENIIGELNWVVLFLMDYWVIQLTDAQKKLVIATGTIVGGVVGQNVQRGT